MQSSSPSQLITPWNRNHPAHTEAVLAKVDALALYINRGKYDPTGEGKRAKNCWYKAYDRFLRMQRSRWWWEMNCPIQLAIVDAVGGDIVNYKVPDWGPGVDET